MSLPSSIAHYTTLEVVNKILTKAIETQDSQMTFHLSNLTMMNDLGEGSFLLNQFFKDSKLKNQMKNEWEDEYYPSHTPFVLSTVRTSKHTVSVGSLPMWHIYGDLCKGVYLRMNFNTLKKICQKSHILFKPCIYRTSTEVNKKVTWLNLCPVFDDIMRECCLTKRKCWEYENEWRILVLTNHETALTKETKRGKVEYIELNIPLDVLEEVCIGPCADISYAHEVLDKLRVRLVELFGEPANFKITVSTIQVKL